MPVVSSVIHNITRNFPLQEKSERVHVILIPFSLFSVNFYKQIEQLVDILLTCSWIFQTVRYSSFANIILRLNYSARYLTFVSKKDVDTASGWNTSSQGQSRVLVLSNTPRSAVIFIESLEFTRCKMRANLPAD